MCSLVSLSKSGFRDELNFLPSLRVVRPLRNFNFQSLTPRCIFAVMSELTVKQKQDYAKLLFVNMGLSQKEVSFKTEVSEKTIGVWVEKFNWKSLRVSMTATRENLLRKYVAQLEELNAAIESRDEGKRYANNKEADTIVKYTAAINNLTSEMGITEVVNVSVEILEFIRKVYPEKAIEISELCDSFIKSKL